MSFYTLNKLYTDMRQSTVKMTAQLCLMTFYKLQANGTAGLIATCIFIIRGLTLTGTFSTGFQF